jgi:chaperonin GroES
MKIRPLHDWVVIHMSEADEWTPGGIIIPEVAKEKPQWGVVVSAGPGRYEDEDPKSKKEKKFVPTDVKAGDKVLYEKYMAKEITVDAEKLVMVRERYILGIFGKEGSTELQKKAPSSLQKKGPSELQKKDPGTVQTVKKPEEKAKKIKK